ncbi:unnamed protein product, partial [Mesorhabditis belari]|uniref:Ig-like domain-containing protein n=1 Tax=Mesorhabditis belari TaxID=2138241 RepID=A0AAF3FCV5_9BILA
MSNVSFSISQSSLLFLLITIIAILLSVHGGPVSKCPEKCHCLKREVNCSHRNLKFLPFGIPKATLHLDLSGNELTELDVARLSDLKRLNTLNLSQNLLSVEAVEEAIERLTKLTTLNLRRNKLNSIPKNLEKLEKLTRIDLRSNNISEIDARDLLVLSTIHQVDLSRNSIRSWNEPSSFDEDAPPVRTSQIQKLDLSSNDLSNLPDRSFSHLSSLISLKISKNKLIKFSPNTWNGLISLQYLDLSRNQLSHLQSLSFSAIPLLQNLSLAENKISKMDDGVFFGVEKLLMVNLSRNHVHNISGSLHFGLQELHTLDLSHNSISWLDAIAWQNVAELRVLNLDWNRLHSLPSGAFSKLRKLQSLTLSGNSIEILHKTALSGLDHLRILDLSSNNLAVCVEDGAFLYNTSLPFLKELRFTNNNLKLIPARAFERFPALEALDLRENPIATIYKGAFEPLALKILYLNTTSLLCDCKLDWWTQWLLVQSQLNRSMIETKCSHPSPLTGIDVTVIDIANLTCMSDSPRPKVITHPPASLKTMIGTDARLNCSGYGEGPIWIEWRVVELAGKSRTLHEDNDTKITSNSHEMLNGTMSGFVSVRGELFLSHVQLTDRAEYQCLIHNQFGTDYSNRTLLEVQEAPIFTNEPDDVALLVGQNARIACSATGVPPPLIKWQKDGGDSFPAAAERRLHVYPNDDHLYVMSVKREDAGVYTCHATNEVGHQQASATLRVYDNSFRSRLNDVKVNEGEMILLDCTVELQDGQRMQWFRQKEENTEKQLLSADNRLTLKARDQLLILVKTSLVDNGIYSCELWAGSHLLARQTANVQIISTPSPPVQRILMKELNEKIMSEKSVLLYVLTTILVIFLVAGFVWIVVYYRRASLNKDLSSIQNRLPSHHYSIRSNDRSNQPILG